jgi:hypothetical protein
MERTAERGSGYPRSERDRLRRMIKDGGLQPEKRVEMEARTHILTTFIRKLLNNRDNWKKFDAKLDLPPAKEDQPAPPAPPGDGAGEGEEEVVMDDDDDDKDL